MNKEKIWTGKLVPATQLESVGVERITSLVWRPFHLISTPPPPPASRPALQGHGKLYFWWGGCVGTVDLWSIPESRGMGKEPRPHHSGRGTGSVALREGDGKCWIALSFRRKSTRAPICRRRPFDRLEIIIGQGSLARTDNHERKNMHVILKLLYTSDPSALVCVLWIVTTIWLASFWSIYRGKFYGEQGWEWR